MRVKNSASLSPNNITLFAIVKVNGFYPGSCHGNQILGKGYPDYANGFYAMRFSDFPNDCGDPLHTENEIFGAAYGNNDPLGSATGAKTDTVKVETGQWYHLTYTYDGIQSRFYVNGELKSVQDKTVNFNANSDDLLIGKHEDPPFPYWFNGVIDEIRIYKQALSASQVKQLNDLKE
jgi:hypothetical protein